jgi:hypothetical protein
MVLNFQLLMSTNVGSNEEDQHVKRNKQPDQNI